MGRATVTGALVALVTASSLAHPARAGIELVPEGLWWRRAATATLASAPYDALAFPRARVESEWWPFYADDRGARFEGARRLAVAVMPIAGLSRSPAALRAGAEIQESFTVARSGAGARGFGLEEVRERRAALGLAGDAGRFGLALSANLGDETASGFALGARVTPAPGWRATAGWSRTSGSGRGSAHWDDVRIEATSDWREETMEARIDGRVGGFGARVQLESLDRMGTGGLRHDGVDPGLVWRAVRFAIGMSGARLRWEIDAMHGSGRQSVRVAREGATYGSVSGPLHVASATLRLAPRNSRLEMRATAGRWDAEGAGFLATWPFEAITAATGTRLVASSRATLEHQGLQLDRLPTGHTGWDGGMAVWHLSPRADYRSWRATFLGLGRDNYREESGLLPEVWMVGLRAALAIAPSGIPMRLECVQWIPVAIGQKAKDAGEPGTPAPGPADPSSPNGSATGGTILRVRVGS